MKDYDAWLGPEPIEPEPIDTGPWLCSDKDCTGHPVAGQHCTDPLYDGPDTDEGVCP